MSREMTTEEMVDFLASLSKQRAESGGAWEAARFAEIAARLAAIHELYDVAWSECWNWRYDNWTKNHAPDGKAKYESPGTMHAVKEHDAARDRVGCGGKVEATGD